MHSLLSKIFADENKPINIRVMNLIAIYIEACAVASFVIFKSIKVETGLTHSIGLLMLLVFALWIAARKNIGQQYTVQLFCYGVNVVILPLFYIFGGGLYSGMPMLFMAGYMLTFVLLDGISLLIAAFITTVWYIFIMTFSFYYPDKIASIPEGTGIVLDLVVCFICASIVTECVLWLHNDIYKKMRVSVERSQKIIEEVGKTKSKFLANMSHELRTPMNAILGMTELLEREETGQDISFEISTIKESAFSLLSTINNVLNFSKLDSDKMELVPEQFRFSKLLKDTIYTISMELEDSNVEFYTDIEATIPDVMYSDAQKIRQIYQYILFNAVNDTDDGRISLKIRCQRNEKKNNYTIYSTISDTGLGLTEDEKQSIFNSFEIYDSRKNSQLKRLGLELTICRDMLELMNGDLQIESINGVGTSVHFRFDVFTAERTPLVRTDKARNERVIVYTTRSTKTMLWNNLLNQFGIVPDFAYNYSAFDARLREKRYDYLFVSDSLYKSVIDMIDSYELTDKLVVFTDYSHAYGDFGTSKIIRKPIHVLSMAEILFGTWDKADYQGLVKRDSFKIPDVKILVVDDNMVNLKVAAGTLARYDAQVAIATSGQEALDKCDREKFDIILMDQVMPEMDGPTTLARLRESIEEHNRKVPVVCLTANIGNEIRDDMLKLGFQEYLAKPIKTRYLEEIFKEFLPEDKIKIVKTKDEEEAGKASEGVAAQFAPGLSSEEGLARVGDNLEVYASILNTYYTEGEQKIRDINQEYSDGDIDMFIINVHSVKGSSASIGGLEVSELFRRLEMAGRSKDMEYIEKNLEEGINKYSELLITVHDFLEEKGLLEDKRQPQIEAEEEEFPMDTMKAFREYVDDFNTDMGDGIVADWSSHNYGPEINNYIVGISKAYDSFDYDMVLEYVDEFLEVFCDE